MEIGGMERVVQVLADELAARGENITLATLQESTASSLVADRAEQLDLGLKSRWYKIDFACLARLLRILRQNRIDLLHSHNPKALLYGSLASALSGIPCVHTVHGEGLPGADSTRRISRLRRFASRSVCNWVAVSEVVRKRLVEVDTLPEDRVAVIRNGIDTQMLARVAERNEREMVLSELDIPADAFVVGSSGRLNAAKNYRMLIRIFAKLMKALPRKQLYLLILGDGSEKGALHRTSVELGVEDYVILPGAVEDVKRYLEAVDVFCLTSVTEGTAMSLLEAGACSIPAVVTDVGGNSIVVKDGVTGFVCDLEDEDLFLSRIMSLCSDTALRRKFGNAAKKHIEKNHSVDAMVSGYMDLYRKATGSPNGGRASVG
jgi:glycosyltransferase involved in cell wall biosynthesis